MAKTIYDNFNEYFPYEAQNASEIIDNGSWELLIKLKDGSRVLYDDIDKTITRLPQNSNNMTEEDFKIEFGKRLRKLMSRKRITQKQLSDRTGISQSLISLYMCGDKLPNFYKADKIAKALRCSMDDLVYADFNRKEK